MSNPEPGAANVQYPADLFGQFVLAGINAGVSHHLEKTIEGCIKETVGSEVGKLRGEMKEMFKDVATKADIKDTNAAIDGLRKDMDAGFAAVRGETSAAIDGLRKDIQVLTSRQLVEILLGAAALLTIAVGLIQLFSR